MINSVSSIINIENLHKNYGNIQAVRGVTFDIKKGEIFGFIGPDGAGKTTLFQMISGVLEPTEGRINILNQNPQEARHEVGYLTQRFSFYSDLSVDENILYSAGLRKIPKEQFYQRRDKYLKLMGLEKFNKRLAGQLSGGMKQKLALCCVLIFQPKILLLDEPTTGVDPISRREFWDVLATLSAENVTIIVATPYLDEAERCNRIALMYAGQITQIGTPKEIRDSLGLYRFEIRTDDIETAENLLTNAVTFDKSQIVDVQTFGDRLDVLVKDPNNGKIEIENLLNSLPVKDINPADIILENVFVVRLRQRGSAPAYVSFPYYKSSKLADNKDNIATQNKVAIGAYNLSKTFGTFNAVNNLTLEVKCGEIYGLLGANGAGKTTTIKMLCGLLSATSGKMFLGGESGNLRSSSLRNRIGYMSQKFTLYDDMTIFENLKFYCGVYNVPHKLRKSKIDWVLEISGLLGQENLITGYLPGGWKQRVSFGASVMHEPDILFLDEPTSGVDPLARRQFWKLIEDFSRHGTAIMVTTHYLEEAEHCNRMAFMSAGEIITQGSPNEIKASQPGKLFEIAVDLPQKANLILKGILDSWQVTLFGNKVHVVLDNPDVELPKVNTVLKENNINILYLNQYPFSLEDAFIGIIERSKQNFKK